MQMQVIRSSEISLLLALLCIFGSVSSISVNWESLSAAQLARIPPQEFSSASSRNISSIPPQAFVGLNVTQLAAFTEDSCHGVKPDQVLFINSSTFQGLNTACVSAMPPESWNKVSADQIAMITNETVAAFTEQTMWNLNAAAFPGIRPDQAAVLSPISCRGISADDMAQLSASVIYAVQSDCLSFIPKDSYRGASPAVVSALSLQAKFVSADRWAMIPPESMKGVLLGYDAVCSLLTPEQVRFVPPHAFGDANMCASDMQLDSWKRLSPQQVANASVVFFWNVQLPRIMLLSDDAIRAITSDQWIQSSIDPSVLPPPDLQRLLTLAGPNLVKTISTPSLKVNFDTIAQYFANLDQTNSVFFYRFTPTVDWTRITWLHFLMLNCSSPDSNIALDPYWPELSKSFQFPFLGLRAACVPILLPSLESFSLIPPNFLGNMPPSVFISFSANQINSITDLSDVDQSTWQLMPPSTLSRLSIRTWSLIPTTDIYALSCDQCKAINQSLINEIRSNSSLTHLAEAFKAPLSKCGLWADRTDNSANKWIVIGSCVGATIVFIIVFIVAVFIAKRRRQQRTRNQTRSVTAPKETSPLLQ